MLPTTGLGTTRSSRCAPGSKPGLGEGAFLLSFCLVLAALAMFRGTRKDASRDRRAVYLAATFLFLLTGVAGLVHFVTTCFPEP
jgi:hypothetical protein